MPYPRDLTDDQWELLQPVFNAPGERGRKHADDLRTAVDAMLCIAQTGCKWRYLPQMFGPWTRVWSQFRRWSRSGTWAQALTALHAAARESDGRTESTPSMVVIDTHLARGASNGGVTFHDRGGPYGRTKGAKPSSPSTRPASRWDDRQPAFRPIRHAWWVEVAHGRLDRPATSLEARGTRDTRRRRLSVGRAAP